MSNNDTVSCYFLSVHLHQTRGALVANIITSVLNSFLSVTAICGNAFVISVIWRREALHVPSNILLCCLAMSDLVVGLISQPSFVIYKVAEIKGYFNVYCAARLLQSCSGWLFSAVSGLTMCAISVDRYLALKLHLRYTAVVTVPRVLVTAIGLWLSPSASDSWPNRTCSTFPWPDCCWSRQTQEIRCDHVVRPLRLSSLLCSLSRYNRCRYSTRLHIACENCLWIFNYIGVFFIFT